MVSDSDNFVVDFPVQYANVPEVKALLMATVVLLDFVYFEDK